MCLIGMVGSLTLGVCWVTGGGFSSGGGLSSGAACDNLGWASGAGIEGDIPGIDSPGIPAEILELDPPVIRPNLSRESRRAFTSPTGAGGAAREGGGRARAGGAGGRVEGPSFVL